MEAVAHSPDFAKKAGVPQSVGKDFAKADDQAGITKTHGGKPAAKPKRDRAAEHMAERKKHGTYATVASEFGTSKTSAHRKVKKHEALRYGYNKI